MFITNRTKRLGWSIIIMAALAGTVIVLSGCDTSGIDASTGPPEGGGATDLGPNVRLQISFDETDATYSSVWPDVIVGNESKSAKSEGTVYMTEYEETSQVRSYDREGYLTSSSRFIEGHPGMNMPADLYAELQNDMPYDPEDENPVVRSEVKNGRLTAYHADGSVARQRSVDPEAFRLSPEAMDSLEARSTVSASVDERREQTLTSLRSRGVSFRQLDDNRVSFTKSVSSSEGAPTVETVVDLRIGEPIYLKYRLKNGNVDMVQTRRYGMYSGMPFPERIVTYKYDDRKGEWGVVSRSETIRSNINVRFN
ncbi:hypothetical protein CRI94_07085 [Longibacter salinarum]|uniref:Uncharacterized protein n=1 Tax=Longibacter salinarum TaxID=1850348 RepID=A0A2A8CYY9_9BACT|nr:hypothetical protein [Longibacter salinarum]PEN13821.1 hypothetical protein CRI94_07085 [Longibacter salinarum]